MAIINAAFFVDEETLLRSTQLTDLNDAVGEVLDHFWLHNAGIHLESWENEKTKEREQEAK